MFDSSHIVPGTEKFQAGGKEKGKTFYSLMRDEICASFKYHFEGSERVRDSIQALTSETDRRTPLTMKIQVSQK